MAGRDEKKETKTRRPANTAFRQQRLQAWQPILTPRSVVPLFLVLGMILAPIGGILLWQVTLVQDLKIDYTGCATKATKDYETIPGDKVSFNFKSNGSPAALWRVLEEEKNYTVPDIKLSTKVCQVQFTLPNDLKPPILFYYELTNFYQNHRKYVKSFSDKQLKGDVMNKQGIQDSDCDPLDVDEATGKFYYPCGLVANSLFNDTFENPVKLTTGTNENNETYFMDDSDIAWSSDKVLFKKYPDEYAKNNFSEMTPPPYWRKQWPDGYSQEHPPPDLGTDEHFMVWMRTAALPTFSKIYMRNDTTAMGNGTYMVSIWDNFPVTTFEGTKKFVITTEHALGARNPFLAYLYLTVGGLSIILGVAFGLTHLFFPRKLGDHTHLKWVVEPNPEARR